MQHVGKGKKLIILSPNLLPFCIYLCGCVSVIQYNILYLKKEHELCKLWSIIIRQIFMKLNRRLSTLTNIVAFVLDFTIPTSWLLMIYSFPVVVQSLSCVQLFATPWTAAHKGSLSFTISQSLLTLTSIESVMPSNHLILCHPLLLLPSIFPSIRVLSSESVLYIGWPKYWCFNFSISASSDYSELISFRIDWSDLLAVQESNSALLHCRQIFLLSKPPGKPIGVR